MAKGKVLQTIIDISGEISPTLGKSFDAVAKGLESVNVKALAAGAAVGAIATGTAVAVAKSIKYLGELGNEYNTAVNDISAGTGLVGKQLDGMADVLKDVYGSNFGESMEDAAAGIAAVYKATGETGDALSKTTKGAYALSDTFGYDVAESARAAKAMMKNFGITGEDAMGLIAAGAQNGLDYSGELIDSVNEYSVQFAKLGFSADDMFKIFQQGADSGAWNLDKVGDAVKEFSIRSIDGSKGTVNAYKELGLNADKMMATFANGGPAAEKAFQQVVGKLVNVKDEVERDAIGVALFGTMWEDLGIDAVKALASVKDGAYDSKDALAQINSVKYDNIGAAFEGIKRQAEVSLLPLAQTVADVFLQLAPIIGNVLTTLGPTISDLAVLLAPIVADFAKTLAPILSNLAVQIAPILGSVLTEIVGVISQLAPFLGQLAAEFLPVLVEVILQVLSALGPIIPMLLELTGALMPVILSLIQAILPIVVMLFEAISPILGLISQLIMALLPPLVNLINAAIPVIQFLAKVFGATLKNGIDAVTPLLTLFTDILGDVIDFVANIFTGNWDGAWQNIVDIFKNTFNLIPQYAESVINSCIGVINGLIEGINSVGDAIGVEISLIPTVTLPRFAAGGFTNGLSIAGEDPNYPTEAIISFNPAYRQQNLSYWAEAGRMLGADFSGWALGTGTSGNTYYELGGIVFSPNVVIHGDADKRTIMEAIEEEYPEFIDMLENYLSKREAAVYG